MEFACLDCGAISDKKRCPKHRREHERQRKAEGKTGARGSTRAGRERRANVLTAAQDGHGIPRCFYCNDEASIADHFHPLSKGGPDTEANLVAACLQCNQEKGDKEPEEFLASEWLAKRRAAVEGGVSSSLA